ncbi:MAG: Cof-type HAD-IIB family hydrolase [Oscillospiraceae bacterium]|nr:Cof-type HAD-IIB family hydrolase [Oscillospiraceae bacterium]
MIDLKYRLIAFDMDGTVLDNKKQMPEACAEALFAAADRGCYIVPATGRMYSGLPKQLNDSRVRYCILINGALVFDAKEEKILYEANINAEKGAGFCRWLDSLPVLYDCYIDNEGFMQADMYDRAEPYFESSRNMYRYVMNTRTKVDCLADFMEKGQRPVQKMQIYFCPHQEALRQELMVKIPELYPEFTATSSLPNNIEINSCKAGKDTGLKALCHALSLSMEETIAFGDGSNDLEIIKAAGLGVAMSNAEEHVKAAADAIAKSNNEAGLALFIDELIATGQI